MERAAPCTDNQAVAATALAATRTVPTSSRVRSPNLAMAGHLVADAVDRLQVHRAARIRFDLAPEVLDMGVDGPLGDEAVTPMGLFQQLAPAEHTPGAGHQRLQDPELGRRALDPALQQADLVADLVE